MSISPGTFWGTNYYQNPPLTDEAIRAAEANLQVTLPEEYLALLRYQNGGYTAGFAHPMSEPTSWAPDHVPLPELFGIVVDLEHPGGHNILQTAYMTAEWGLPPRQVLLAGDGHWWITLDYRKSDRPSVAWIDVDVHEDLTIAPSFRSFLDGLVPASRYDA